MYDAFPDLYPLRSGLRPGTDKDGTVSMGAYRRMMLYHDNRFARNKQFVAVCCNTIVRHAVNRNVGLRTRTSPAAFDRFVAPSQRPTT